MIRTTYPDPDSVAYPTTSPPRFPCRMTLRAQARLYPIHAHGAWIDKHGNGNTDADSGHFHYVRNGIVQPDPRDGHTHQMSILPCGAG